MYYIVKGVYIILCYLDDDYYFFENGDYGKGIPKFGADTVLTTSLRRYSWCKTEGIPVISLSKYLGVSQKVEPLYTIYDYFFKGNVTDDLSIIIQIFDAFIFKKAKVVFCLWLDNSVCWFSIDNKSIEIIGELMLDEPISKFSVGEFYKRLRYQLVQTDVSLNNVVMLSYGVPLADEYLSSYIDVQKLFNCIDGLKHLSLPKLVERLSNSISTGYSTVTARSLVNGLKDSSKALCLRESDGHLYTRQSYYKDYSVCSGVELTKYKDCQYGYIIDCEGVTGSDGSLQNGCRQLGVVLYAEYQGKMGVLETHLLDGELLTECLLQLPDYFRVVTGRPSLRGAIKTYVYGSSDKIMIESHIKNCGKKVYKQLKGKFDFIDVKGEINHYMNETGMTSKRTLQNIARHLGVYALRPKHNALADARTLFNVLCEIKKGEYYER